MASPIIKQISFGILFFFIGFGGIILYTKHTTQKKAEERKSVAAKSAFSLENAPKATVKGDIVNLTGEVLWISRIATESAPLVISTKIQEGEGIETKSTGSLTLTFAEIGTVSMLKNTLLDFIQTYPSSFVLSQQNGEVVYEKTGTGDFSIRSLHLLTQINSGKASLIVDAETEEITISVLSGSVTVAYNDLDNLSTVETATSGETLIYDEATRTTTIQ